MKITEETYNMEDKKNTKETNKLIIQNKFYGFSGVLIVSLLFTALLTIVLMRQINNATTLVSDNWLPSVILAEEINTATSNFRIAEVSHVISQDNERMLEYENAIKEISHDINLMFERYASELVTNEKDATLLARARSLWRQYGIVHSEMINFSRENDTASAMALMENESERLFNDVSALFLELVSFNKQGVDSASKEGDYIYTTTIFLVLLLLFITALVFTRLRGLVKEIEETQTQLRYAHEEALLLSQAKSNFLANMSHEIRTPMNAICGMVDIIIRESKENEISDYALSIKRACDSLLAIINDVLDISKIESGKLDIVEAEYTLSNVLNDVLAIATNRLELKPLMFIATFQPDLPNKLIGDDVRIKQIMVNILNNAIKFTHEGHIHFEVSGKYENNSLELKFSVTDTGMGISRVDMEKLFVEFERVNTKKNRSIEGTGLGLAISKRLAEMMDGSISVESEVGKGTTFSVTVKQKYDEDYIPIAKVEETKSVLIFESRDLYRQSIEKACKELSLKRVVCCALQSELNEALAEQEFDFIFTSSLYHHKVQKMLTKMDLHSKIVLLIDNTEMKSNLECPTILLPVHAMSIANVLNGKSAHNERGENFIHFTAPECKILVVDDNVVNLNVARGLMKPYQFNIETAANGEEAYKMVRDNKYDLVFMDHMMPVMDGIDATIAIRNLKEEYYLNIPIVALTANAIIGTREMFIKEGMNDFLAKPIKLNHLNDILLKWLPKELVILHEDAVQEVKTDMQSKEFEIPNVDTKLGLSRIGGDFETYIEILDMYYKDGVKRASSILGFFNGKHLSEYKIEVHALKSASASIGATEISNEAKALEDAATRSDWDYINQATITFLDDFNALLENIRNATKELIKEVDFSDKQMGDNTFYKESLKNLEEALDSANISLCDKLLEGLYQFNWDEEKLESLSKIKNFISAYEYDEAVEYIQEILA